jgi:hypothetical protein
MRASTLVVMLALVAAPAAAQTGMGTPGGGWPGGEGHGRRGHTPEGVRSLEEHGSMPELRNPVRVALDDSAQLALSADQAGRLRAAADSLDATNAPLLAQVRRTLGEDGTAQPVADDSVRAFRMQALKSYFDRIRWNNDQAWKASRGVLTRDQQKKLADLRRDEERERDRRDRERERRENRGRPRPTGPGGEPPSVGA